MTPSEIIALRDGTRATDLAIFDTLQLLAHGLPAVLSVAELRRMFRLSQPQLHRRLAAVGRLGVLEVRNHWGVRVILRDGSDEDAATLAAMPTPRPSRGQSRRRWEEWRQGMQA